MVRGGSDLRDTLSRVTKYLDKSERTKEMKVICPHCGKTVVIDGLGRKPLNIGLEKIIEALRRHCSAEAAGQELGCSEGHIFGILKEHGLKLKDVREGNAPAPVTSFKLPPSELDNFDI
jgi:hypothetical protein